MSLYIKNPEVDSMARKLAHMEGVSVTEAVAGALRDRLQKKPRKLSPEEKMRAIRAIQRKAAKLPIVDRRSPDEIMGFNDFGAFD